MARCTLTIKVRFPWWARAYIAGCALFAKTFGMQPDIQKMTQTILRHTRLNSGLRTAHPQEGPKA